MYVKPFVGYKQLYKYSEYPLSSSINRLTGVDKRGKKIELGFVVIINSYFSKGSLNSLLKRIYDSLKPTRVIGYPMLWTIRVPKNFICWNHAPQCDIIKGTLGDIRIRGHDLEWDQCPLKVMKELAVLCSPPGEVLPEVGSLQSSTGLSPQPNHTGTLISFCCL